MKSSILSTEELFDSHCHLNADQFDIDRDAVVKAARSAGVKKIVDVATDIESALKCLENADEYEDLVVPTIGIHPEILIPGSDLYSDSFTEKQIEVEILKIRQILDDHPQKFAMIGECGLDYYWLAREVTDLDKIEQVKHLQRVLFKSQIEVAIEYELPLTIHSRDAHEDTMRILADVSSQVDAVLHSFTGNFIELMQIVEHGFYIGINGIITFNSAKDLQNSVRSYLKGKTIESPLDLYRNKILLETDSPYLAPVPHRGDRNQPAYVKDAFDFVKENLS